ncbi:hypothetical protein ACTFIV_006860 [Dictyostelium citrinum]
MASQISYTSTSRYSSDSVTLRITPISSQSKPNTYTFVPFFSKILKPYREQEDTRYTSTDLIARILTIAFNDLLSNKKEIPSKFKEGVITTIFKKGDELNISNRRPITLLNTDYKILSKVLNSRLLDITSKIINKFQNGFVPNRFIQDNIQIMKEINKIDNYPSILKTANSTANNTANNTTNSTANSTTNKQQ